MFLKFVELLLCPVLEICSRVHKRAVYVCSNDSTIERHLSLEACELSPEKYCILDLAKQEYATHLQEGKVQALCFRYKSQPRMCQPTTTKATRTTGPEAERFRDAQKS